MTKNLRDSNVNGWLVWLHGGGPRMLPMLAPAQPHSGPLSLLPGFAAVLSTTGRERRAGELTAWGRVGGTME